MQRGTASGVATEGGPKFFRAAADAVDLERIRIFAAAKRAGIGHEQAARVQFQRVNAGGLEDFGCAFAFPHDGRAAAAALDIEQINVKRTCFRQDGYQNSPLSRRPAGAVTP